MDVVYVMIFVLLFLNYVILLTPPVRAFNGKLIPLKVSMNLVRWW